MANGQTTYGRDRVAALRPFAITARQHEYLDAILEHGSPYSAETALGVSHGMICRAMRSIEARRLADERKRSIAPLGRDGFEAREVSTTYGADGAVTGTRLREGPPSLFEAGGEDAGAARDGFDDYFIKGVSTYFGRDGQQVGQWVKTQRDAAVRAQDLREAIVAFLEDKPLPGVYALARPDYQSDIIPWIQIGDAHLGMLAHAAETGENFDLKIAEAELCAAIGILIDELPSSERIVINDLGDFTHYENMAGVTEASGHPLDYDGRFPKMIKVYSRVMRWIIDKALEKAQHVDVIINQGNHSRTNDIWMAELLRVAYGESGRVHVLNNDSVFIAYRMGKTLVMVHHTDKAKPKDLVGVMITDFREDFGETEFHYIDGGHVHHSSVSKEHPSVIFEAWNHLAASDKWAHDAGYRSRKAITCVLRSRTYGEVGRRLLPIEEIRDRMNAAMGGAPAMRRKLPFTV